ncbi:relaxase/mobilization nuclease domain-containing protein [Lutibacter sp. A80]|uniref:relaxase/mobilization nuclease domain-containing protein n=1 Tax=Lutibacter sp. A80 TaxID=2918453 RepID=UPI001F070C5A|nr:relaxase/mobilization nuclease domain-containing protein [Lutibacter sp. A80]UMB59985.1 relaxase/mobilization nuclease domain-containing protein [Lutibacter sp. A80]
MITKIESINHTYNALAYCEKGGEILYTNKCLGTSKDIFLQMKENNAFNDRCSKPTFHIKIRIAPEDKGKLNSQDWIDISKSYAAKIGFQYNPYAIYIHKEGTAMEHIHCVAAKITEKNLAVTDDYTHYKSMDFSREIEEKYNLRKVKRVLETVKNNEVFESSDKRIPPLKEKIFQAITMSDTLEDLEFHLKQRGIKVKIGRGISFTDELNISFRGSKIDRRLSLRGIRKLLSYENQEKQEFITDFKDSNSGNGNEKALSSKAEKKQQDSANPIEYFDSDIVFDSINNFIDENNSNLNDSEDFEKRKKKKKKNRRKI